MTPTSTRDQHVDALTAMLYPAYTKRCDHCGGFVVTSAEETLKRWTDACKPYVDLATSLQYPTASAATGLPTATPWTSTWTSQPGRHHGHHDHHHHGHDHGCGCYSCEPDDCHCRCCVVNADLVVNARLGERRILPITIENNRRRERSIKLELSEFASKGGSPSNVEGRLLTPAEFTLAACEQREAVIGITVAEASQTPSAAASSTRGRRRTATSDGESNGDGGDGNGGRELPDVDDCEVAYADLRIVGCDNRPVRIAVSTLPRDCHSYPVDCACGCC